MKIQYFLSFFILLSFSVASQQPTSRFPKIWSDHAYAPNDNVFVFYKNAKCLIGTDTLYADSIFLSKTTSTISFTGNVQLKRVIMDKSTIK